MANTTKGYPYPIDTDSADVPSDVQLLAEAVDASPGIASLTQTQIDALSAAEKWAGRVVWNQTTNKLQRSDGSSFVDLVLTSDSRLTDARTPTAHASSHASAGSDPITIAQSQVTDLSTALAAKGNVAGETWTGTHDFSGATMTGVAAGLTLISSTTIGSGVTSIAISSCFSASYMNYRIVISGGTASANSDGSFILGASTTGYHSSGSYNGYTSTAYGGFAVANHASSGTVWAYAGNGLTCDLILYGPYASGRTAYNFQAATMATASNRWVGGGFHDVASSFTGITFQTQGGHTVSGGTIKVYGIED